MIDRTSRPWLRRLTRRAPAGTPLDLEQAAGWGSTLHSRRARRQAWQPVEQLEARVLLAGDHPSFSDFPLATPLGPFDINGRTSETGIISSPTDDDVFRFQAPMGASFISILADTVNTADPSTLDSRVRVYDANGNQLTRMGVPIDGRNNGVLSTTRPGVATDGWLNFIATPGEFYFVRVSGENGTTGSYVLRVNAGFTDLTPAPSPDNQKSAGEAWLPDVPDVDPVFGFPVALPTVGPDVQTIAFPQDEQIYRIVVPDDPIYDSLATVTARSDRTNPAPAGGFLDTHLEVYDAVGNLLATDIEAGYLNDAFAAWRSRPGETYYIRVRGDDLRDPNLFPSVGNFQIRVDLSAREIVTSMITRRGDLVSTLLEDTSPTPDPVANILLINEDSALFRFKAQGTGPTFITVRDTGPLHNVSLRVFGPDGAMIAFNDDFVPTDPSDAQVQVNLVGGETYFIVVDGFPDDVSGLTSTFNVWIEAHHTLAPTPVDDHANTPDEATPLRFGDPTLQFDSDVAGPRNPLWDHPFTQTAIHTGRITPGDSDFFSFVPPIDMLGTYPGDNDDAGAALFVGGRFNTADPDNLFPRPTGSVAIWDAWSWWTMGREGNVGDLEFGFFDNPNTPGTSTAEVYAIKAFDLDGAGTQFPPMLAVGGDFLLKVPGIDPFSGELIEVEIQNLAVWVFDPLAGQYVWVSLGDPDGPVRAIEVYDPVTFDPDGDGDDPAIPDPGPARLIIGGDFDSVDGVPADKLASWRGDWQQVGDGLGAGPSGSVRALIVYDPPDPGAGRDANPGPPPLPAVDDPPDIPSSLFIGGRSDAGAVLMGWNGAFFFPVASGSPLPDFTIGGGPGTSIDAFAVFDPPDPDGDGEIPDQGPFLYIGGTFNSIGGVVSPNLIQWGRPAIPEAGDPNSDPEAPGYQPRLLYEPVSGGVATLNGDTPAVLALTVWDPPDVFGPENPLPPMLVAGGRFDVAGGLANNIVAWDGGGFLALGNGIDGVVHALEVSSYLGQNDVQEPSIPLLDEQLGGGLDPQQALYIGGEFTVNGSRNIAQFVFDPDPFVFAFVYRELESGVAFADGSPSAVFALAMFDDQDPTVDNSGSQWDRNDRPAGRLQIIVSGTGDSFLDVGIRVYDSNFNLVYPTAAAAPYHVDPADPDGGGPLPDPPPFNTTINPLSNDPAGMIDPITAPGTPAEVIGIEVWGGETYYVEVLGAARSGRYTISVRVAALPPDVNGDGVFDNINGSYHEVFGAGRFADAPNIVRNLDNGDGRNFTNSQVDLRPFVPDPGAYQQQSFITPPALGVPIVQYMELGNIETPADEDLYSFIAEESGWVEVRVATIGMGSQDHNTGETLGDEFVEDFGPDGTPDAVKRKVYTSRLDSALRIFNNDFEEIAYNDNFSGIAGEVSVHNTGGYVRAFTERDPRVVFRVERGIKYYIQVESGQKATFLDPDLGPDFVDYRHATGAYELLVNTMPFLNFEDDHWDGVGPVLAATPIPIGDRDKDKEPVDELPNGVGRVTGIIDDTANNPNDEDFFYMIAPTTGPITARVTIETAGLALAVTVFDEFGQIAAQGGGAGPTINLNWFGQQGAQYIIAVDGSAGEGAYAIDINTLPYVDDHADYLHWEAATPLQLSRFFGTFTASGSIESPGDTDLFVFTAEQYEVATVTVTATGSLNTYVRVYEIGEDAVGNPTFLRINYNDDASATNTNSTATFSVTPTRPYYILVSGSDPNADFGGYQVTVQVRSTDDHPDLVDLPVATTIPINYDSNLGTGTGTADGVIERPEDEDLFAFIAPTDGSAEITITTATGTLRPRVRLFNAQGTTLAQSTGADGTVTISANGLVAGQQYYVLVEAPLDGSDTPTPDSYTVDVATAAADDHPDAGQFDLAASVPIVLSPTSGFGSRSGQLLPFYDTDLFYFETIAPGQVVVEVVTPTSSFDPQVRIFNAAQEEIRFSRGNNDTVTIIFTASAANQGFYILVEPDSEALPGTLTGAYSVRISAATGGGGGGGGPDDHVNAGDWLGASLVSLDERTGDGQRTGVINYLGDTDLFSVFTLNRGKVRVQVVAADGSALDAAIRVYRGDQVQIRADTLGIPGNTAYTEFDAGGAGELYFVLVEQVGPNLGPYTLMINSEPLTHYLYYPEGFSGATIDEFIPMVNPNDFDVEYTIIARYEVGERDQVLATGVIKAKSRGGITVSTKSGENPHNVRIGVPYAIEIQSTGQLGATLSHYDFGVTTGENFTERTSNTWFFSEAHRNVDQFRDFLVVYNPNDVDTNVTFTLLYEDGSVTTFTRTVAALRRGGVNFTTDGSVTKDGVFAIKVDSSLPIVAALSSFDIISQRGYGLLGNPDGGSTEGVVPTITTGSGVESFVSIFNPGVSTATVTLRGTYQRADLPDLVRVISIGAGSRFSASLAELGLVPSQIAGLRYTSTAPVVFTAVQYRSGDGDATTTPTHAFTTALIGDAFVNPAVAGITYVEELALYNPAGIDVNVTITFLFDDGSVGQFINPGTGGSTINIGPDSFAFIRIDQQPAILNRPGLAFFSILIEAPTPIAGIFNHYDFFLDGGWGTAPAPVGFAFPLNRI